ncbi:MAG: hypothetical protein EHM78_16765 [Myxococcaceae bacterium]|nr:MAG: hypothetical protein EHM78_16765 [Myxococcaceae bacterium]
MRAHFGWMVVCLGLAGPAKAGIWDGQWTHDLDLSAGFGSGAVTTAFRETTGFGFFDGRVKLGAGPRLFAYFGGSDVPFTTSNADLISAGRVNTLTASDARNLALNLALSLQIRVWAGLELGANIDVIGVGFGSTRTAQSTTGAFQGPHEASPPSFNLLTLGRSDKGTLDSEFYAAWWFDDRVAVRAGASHVVTELVTDEPLDDGNTGFRRVTTLFFIAASYRF